MSISSAAAPDIIRVRGTTRRRGRTRHICRPRGRRGRRARSIFSAARGPPRPSPPRFRLLGEGSGRKRSISGLATEKEREETPTSSAFTTRKRRERERGAVVKEQGHGPPSPPSLSFPLPSLRQRPTKLIRQLNSPLSSSLPPSQQQPRSLDSRPDGLADSLATKKRGTLLPPPPTPLLSLLPSTRSSPAACPFVRQSDSPSVLRGLLPLPPTRWWRGRTSADGSISAVYDLVPS